MPKPETVFDCNIYLQAAAFKDSRQRQQIFDCQKPKRYLKIMKVETTIAIEADLLKQVEVAAKDFRSYSEVFEKALLEYLPKLNRKPSKRDPKGFRVFVIRQSPEIY